MNLTKKISFLILYPLSLIYDVITSLRNFLYDKKILSTIKFSIPIISVGNLSVGGTGKTPFVEYLSKHYLDKKYNIAILSRGYKRKTTGYIIAEETQNYLSIGDEPMQYYLKFNDKLIVSVCEDRIYGINRIINDYPKTNLIILDDGFQQRKINSSFNIVISNFNKPFFCDYLLPFGLLREKRVNISRADLVVFSKVPKDVFHDDFKNYTIESKKYLIRKNNIFFTEILYSKLLPLFNRNLNINSTKKVIAASSISESSLFIGYIKSKYNLIKSYNFPDHHIYKINDIDNIFNNLKKDTILIITEKDVPKFKIHKNKISNYPIFFLPIQVNIILNEKKQFFNKIDTYLNSYN